VIIFIIIFFVSWILGVLRFNYQWAHILDSALLFPCGFLNITLSDYSWHHITGPSIFKDEIFEIFAFLLSVLGQTFIYHWIYKMVLKRRKNKKEASRVINLEMSGK
jgi:predicted membrane protein